MLLTSDVNGSWPTSSQNVNLNLIRMQFFLQENSIQSIVFLGSLKQNMRCNYIVIDQTAFYFLELWPYLTWRDLDFANATNFLWTEMRIISTWLIFPKLNHVTIYLAICGLTTWSHAVAYYK
jgi:hypothetical protein